MPKTSQSRPKASPRRPMQPQVFKACPNNPQGNPMAPRGSPQRDKQNAMQAPTNALVLQREFEESLYTQKLLTYALPVALNRKGKSVSHLYYHNTPPEGISDLQAKCALNDRPTPYNFFPKTATVFSVSTSRHGLWPRSHLLERFI